MIVLVCGSRDWDDVILEAILGAMLALHEEVSWNDDPVDPFEVIAGGATGADAMAAAWARERGVPVTEYPADWERYGKAAGPLRNRRMLAEGKPNCVLAFSHQPTSRGTADMIRQAKEAGVIVWQIGNP